MSWEVGDELISNYLNRCKSFCENDDLFHNFKKDEIFRVILEHLNEQEGQFYFNKITDEELLSSEKIINKLKENDLFCNPDLYSYSQYGLISPSTIRYISNLSDIKNHFPNKKFNKIFEIGGGYGGLAKTINCYYDYDSYTIIDQPEVNMLSKKYLALFPDLENKINQLDCFNYEKHDDIDLLISNYALSELSLESQKEYYDKIIINSNNFYIIYNHFTGNHKYDFFYKMAAENFNIETETEMHGNTIMYGYKK